MASSLHHHTTQSHPAYEPASDGVKRRWQIVVAALVVIAVVALAVRPVCRPDAAASADESALGVRHERRGTTWYHCEPWLRRALAN